MIDDVACVDKVRRPRCPECMPLDWWLRVPDISRVFLVSTPTLSNNSETVNGLLPKTTK